MAELHPDNASNAARAALGYAQAFDGKDINWQSDDPWPHRIELAQALDWIAELGAMVLNLSERVQMLELAEEGAKEAFGHVVQAKRDLEAECKRLRELLTAAHAQIRNFYMGTPETRLVASAKSEGQVRALLREALDTLTGPQAINCIGMAWYERTVDVLGPNVPHERLV